jgi:hypothetical protein
MMPGIHDHDGSGSEIAHNTTPRAAEPDADGQETRDEMQW